MVAPNTFPRGERSERCQWQKKRGERVAAVAEGNRAPPRADRCGHRNRASKREAFVRKTRRRVNVALRIALRAKSQADQGQFAAVSSQNCERRLFNYPPSATKKERTFVYRGRDSFFISLTFGLIFDIIRKKEQRDLCTTEN